MSTVMTSAWNFASPAILVVDDDDEEEEEVTATTAPQWPQQFSPRWLIAALSLLFLWWVWSEDKNNTNNDETMMTAIPDVVTV